MRFVDVVQDKFLLSMFFYGLQPIVFIMSLTSVVLTILTLNTLNKELRYFNQRVRKRIMVHHVLIFLVSIITMLVSVIIFVSLSRYR